MRIRRSNAGGAAFKPSPAAMTICSWGAVVASPAMNTPGKLVGPFASMTISALFHGSR